MVLPLRQTLLVANTIFAFRHERIASFICLADIAYYATPAIITFTLLIFRGFGLACLLMDRRAAKWHRTIFTTESSRAGTSSGRDGAVAILETGEVVKVAIETWRAVRWSIIEDGDLFRRIIGGLLELRSILLTGVG